VTWRRGTFLFKNGLRTEMSSVEKSLQTTLLEGVALLDQLKHLEKAGLVYESILVQKQKNLGEPELKLMLAKGHPLDFQMQKNAYDSLKHKKTFTDLLRDNPMDQTQWAPLLFNLLYCGLIEIKPPAATRGGALDFLGEGKQIIQNLAYNFVRPDTGIVSFEALLYFLEYEFYRYEAYNWPMSLVAFEMSLRRPGSNIGETEPLPPQALATAAMRIGLVKRPLDLLTHFQVNEYAILMPNTKASQAAFVANRILDALTVTPLAPGIDRANISLSFGVANLPSDGEDVESLLQAAEQARLEAREGNFPIVLARTGKKE
ncbi:MAG TPA: diguanylate cyclase, partial [Candidatus Obscuribacter sp.]|nr:diguanylate cyclase [Candidatus Obscuribacter sp.]